MKFNEKTVLVWMKVATFVMFGLSMLMGSFLGIGIMKARKFQKARIERLKRDGYQKINVCGEMSVSNPPARPTWYMASGAKTLNGADAPVAVVKLLAGANAPVALYCATGEVSGVVHGDLLFVGRTLIIHPGAVLESNLETTCWMVKQFGEVRGEIRGTRNFFVTNQTPATATRQDGM